LRQLLIHGARAVLRWVERKDDPTNRWARGLKSRRHTNVAAVAAGQQNRPDRLCGDDDRSAL